MVDHKIAEKSDNMGVLSPNRQNFSESKIEFNTQKKVEAVALEKRAESLLEPKKTN